MFLRQFIQSVLGLVFLVSSSLALSNTEFTYDLPDRDDNGIELTGCIGDPCPSDLVIPEEIDGTSVRSIGPYSFGGHNLTNVTLPDSVTDIGRYAFERNQLTSINIPYSVTHINDSAFIYNLITEINFLGDRPAFTPGAFQAFWLSNPDSEEGGNYDHATIHYCYGATGWPGEPIEGITPTLDVNCDSDNDGVINTEEDFPFDSSRHSDDSQYSALDLDQNGSFDALTDALMIMRYAFGLRGDALISNAIASDANRTSAEEIKAHIQSILP
jgi:hypothetical protein